MGSHILEVDHVGKAGAIGPGNHFAKEERIEFDLVKKLQFLHIEHFDFASNCIFRVAFIGSQFEQGSIFYGVNGLG